ncbi:MAG: hypothetical protein JXB48_05490 [Candidatus Latescibacteria bacterium]|nr:hypothetical protein [Candidatus Latescibacterota bacterium]
MTATKTKIVSFDDLCRRESTAPIVVKLMMACNDLSLANEALLHWKEEQSPMQKHRELGAKMYFVRIELSHLFEGLKVIDEIRKNNELMTLLSRCDRRTQNSFNELVKVLPGGTEWKKLEKLIGQLRHNLAFHYDKSGKLIKKAIADRASSTQTKNSSITRGSSMYLWRFNVADDIVDSIVVRQLWGIPRQSDLSVEADSIAEYIHKIFLSFVDFAGEFIWKYLGH